MTDASPAQGSTERPLPLAGVRVLDIATMAAAPWAATYLAEFGADVIKVEMPGTGDHQRRFSMQRVFRNPIFVHEWAISTAKSAPISPL